ncbi:hypothetical protein [Methylobacterium fujisawaense]
MNNLHVNETVWRYHTEGVEKTRSDVDKLAGSLDKATAAQSMPPAKDP